MRNIQKLLILPLFCLSTLFATAQTVPVCNTTDTELINILGYWQSLDRDDSLENFIKPNPKIYFIISRDREGNYYLANVKEKDYRILSIQKVKNQTYLFTCIENKNNEESITEFDEYTFILKLEGYERAQLTDPESKFFKLGTATVEMIRLAGPKKQ